MVSVTKKFQVTIPKDVREDMNIQSGDKVVFVKNNAGEWVLMTVKTLADMMVASKEPKITDSEYNDSEDADSEPKQSFTSQFVK